MAARSLGSATIAFGMVAAPVKLYPTTDTKAGVSFNQINSKTGHRCKQQLVDGESGVVVPKEDIVKGYEFSKGQYVTFTPEEVKALEEQATGTIEIVQFVPLASVERLWLEKAYYLAPDKGGDRSFALLVAALDASGRAAIGQYAARGKGYVVLLRPEAGRLVMEQLHYANERRAIQDVPVPVVELKEQELKMAGQLIEMGAVDTFDATQFTDGVTARMLAAIEQKVAGGAIIAQPQQTETKVLDLMEALKASVAKQAQRKAVAA
jgi:DNA end-binding protein Ku